MIRLLTIAAMSVYTSAALADVVPTQQYRTVEWYAANPAVMAKVRRACQNDPGHAARNPDCINSHYAEIETLEREQTGPGPSPFDFTPPTSPEFWRKRPAERAERLQRCALMKNARDREAYFCGPAGYAGP